MYFCKLKFLYMEKIIIRSGFGHEIGAAAVAKYYGVPLMVIPRKDNKDDYEKEADNIVRNISFFNLRIEVVPFEKKDTVDGWDFVKDLTGRQIKDDFWKEFAKVVLTPTESVLDLPMYAKLRELKDAGYTIIGVATGKLVSDGLCGVTASQQTLPFETFEFLREIAKDRKIVFVNLQHFSKVNDLDKVEAFEEYFMSVYTPGKTEHPEVFGVRGVPHKMYYHMFGMLDLVLAIAGTHTWYAETMFPNLAIVNLFNLNGVENWKAKEEAYREVGRVYYSHGYNENTDLVKYSNEIKETVLSILGE